MKAALFLVMIWMDPTVNGEKSWKLEVGSWKEVNSKQ